MKMEHVVYIAMFACFTLLFSLKKLLSKIKTTLEDIFLSVNNNIFTVLGFGKHIIIIYVTSSSW